LSRRRVSGSDHAAIITGNPLNSRIERLREFWTHVTSHGRLSMEEHWRAGYHDARRTFRHREVLQRPKNPEGVFIFDLAEDGRE
jgi:hypothetical protein